LSNSATRKNCFCIECYRSRSGMMRRKVSWFQNDDWVMACRLKLAAQSPGDDPFKKDVGSGRDLPFGSASHSTRPASQTIGANTNTMRIKPILQKLLLLLGVCLVSGLALSACQSTDEHSRSEHPTKEHPEHPTTNAPSKSP